MSIEVMAGLLSAMVYEGSKRKKIDLNEDSLGGALSKTINPKLKESLHLMIGMAQKVANIQQQFEISSDVAIFNKYFFNHQKV